jgi:outer membrane protein OmpA-like peptidoglycan-associated protein
MSLWVVDHVSGEPLDANVNFKNKIGDILPVQTATLGRFEIDLTSTSGSSTLYKFNVSSKGYATFSSTFYFHGLASEALQDTIRLEKAMIDLPYPLNVYFALDSDQPLSTDEMQNLLIMLMNNKTMKVEIGGHTDNFGAEEYNLNLSQRRANAVRTYLVKSGADASRITAIGYGTSKPIASNQTKEGRRKNRRTEFKILAE